MRLDGWWLSVKGCWKFVIGFTSGLVCEWAIKHMHKLWFSSGSMFRVNALLEVEPPAQAEVVCSFFLPGLPCFHLCPSIFPSPLTSFLSPYWRRRSQQFVAATTRCHHGEISGAPPAIIEFLWPLLWLMRFMIIGIYGSESQFLYFYLWNM